MGDSWYSGGSVIAATRFRRFEYIGALKTNRVIHSMEGSRLGQVNEYVKSLTKNDVHLVTVGNRKYWVHRVNGYNKKLPKGGVILITWSENQLFQEGATHVFFSTRNHSDEIILNTYSERWTIEIFFRDNKMQLELDRYQVRTTKAIKKFLTIIMVAYSYCITIGLETNSTIGAGRRQERREMKRNMVAFVYQQAQSGVQLTQINEQLGLA